LIFDFVIFDLLKRIELFFLQKMIRNAIKNQKSPNQK